MGDTDAPVRSQDKQIRLQPFDLRAQDIARPTMDDNLVRRS